MNFFMGFVLILFSEQIHRYTCTGSSLVLFLIGLGLVPSNRESENQARRTKLLLKEIWDKPAINWQAESAV